MHAWQWHGMAWHVMAWHGMTMKACHGMAWHGNAGGMLWQPFSWIPRTSDSAPMLGHKRCCGHAVPPVFGQGRFLSNARQAMAPRRQFARPALAGKRGQASLGHQLPCTMVCKQPPAYLAHAWPPMHATCCGHELGKPELTISWASLSRLSLSRLRPPRWPPGRSLARRSRCFGRRSH